MQMQGIVIPGIEQGGEEEIYFYVFLLALGMLRVSSHLVLT